MQHVAISPLLVKAWPDRDQALWAEAQVRDDIFDEGGLAASWRPATRSNAERGYGIWLAWLSQRGELDGNIMLVDRIDRAKLETFIAEYRCGRADYTVASVVRGIADLLRAAQPVADLLWLKRIGNRMMRCAKPSRNKLERLVSIAVLATLGENLMREGAEMIADGRRSGAQVYRDGLLIAILAERPALRRKDLANLRLGRSLLQEEERFRILFESHETKAKRRLEAHLPAWLTPYANRYIRQIRPILLTRATGPDEGWLWIGRRGRRMPANLVSTRISKLTGQRLGRRVSPQLFRDCAATDIAIHRPGQVKIIKPVLNHALFTTGEKFYNQATSLQASEDWQNCLKDIRR